MHNVLVLLTDRYKKIPVKLFSGVGKVVIAHIIDRERLSLPAADFAELMKSMEKNVEEIKEVVHRLGIPVKSYEEWGKLEEKVKVICAREEIDRVIVFDKKLKGLDVGAEVMVI